MEESNDSCAADLLSEQPSQTVGILIIELLKRRLLLRIQYPYLF